MRKRTRRAGWLAGLCAVALTLGLGALPAAAQERPQAKPPPTESGPTGRVPEGFRSWEDLLRRQDRLNTAADRLSEAAESEPGFTGIVAAPERPYLTLFWHGELPERIAELVTELPGEVPVEVLPARHSLAELLAAQEPIATEPGVTSVTPHIDGSGLTVGYRGSEEAAWQLEAVRAARVPVTIAPRDEVVPLGCSGRLDDCKPVWGGAKYVLPTGGWCSTGFLLRLQPLWGLPTWYPYYGMLSAGHCGSDGDQVVDGGGEAMGTIVQDIDGADLLLIGSDDDVFGINTTFGPRVYVDSWQLGFPSRAVAGTAGSYVGNYSCTSGAATGEHCGVRVDAVNVTIWGTVKTVRATQWAGLTAAGKGDSGGPVIGYRWWNLGRVNAQGTISAGSGPTACPAGAPSSACFETVYFVDINTALARLSNVVLDVEIVTG